MAYAHPSPLPHAALFRRRATIQRDTRPARLTGLVIVAAIHVALIVPIWQSAPAAQHAIARATPVIVRLLSPDPPLPPERHMPPLPKTTPKPKAVEPPPVQTFAPPPAPIPSSAVAPVTTVPEPPPPTPAIEAAAPAPSAPPAPATPPRFDADYLRNPSPVYPALSRRSGEQGRVLLRVLVGVDGSAQQVELKTSSGHQRLDQAAVDTVREWRFVPARLGSDAIAAWVVVPISFSLGR